MWIGQLTRTCKSTRRHTKEMISNLQLLQCAHQHLNDPQMNSVFKKHLFSFTNAKEYVNKENILPSQRTIKVNSLAVELFKPKRIAFFHRLQIGNLTLCNLHMQALFRNVVMIVEWCSECRTSCAWDEFSRYSLLPRLIQPSY